MTSSPLRIRLGAIALAVGGILFLLYPVIRPWQDKEATVAGTAAALSSGAWVTAHFFAMIGFILLPLGLLALRAVVAETRAEPLAFLSLALGWVGVGLILPFYGAEDFGLHAAVGRTNDLLGYVDAVRNQPVALTMFGVGLLTLAAAAIIAGVAVARSGVLDRFSGVLFAAGFALYLPQFFAPPAVRIGHGLLVAAGMIVLGWSLWRQVAAGHSAEPTPQAGQA